MPFGGLKKKPNIIIFLSDEQRAIQHFPDAWVQKHLPNLNKLKQQGITFKNAITNTSPCSPARGLLFTGLYPALNGLYQVGATLPPTTRNKTNMLSNLMKTAGYRVIYKGKWHMSSHFDTVALDTPRIKYPTAEQQQQLQAEDDEMLNTWQFEGWNAPDGGTALIDNKEGLETTGGSWANNDSRIVQGPSLLADQQCVLDFIAENQDPETPFCLVVSLINPHDIVFYETAVIKGQTTYPQAFKNYQGFELPESYFKDDLTTKPWVQSNYLALRGGKPAQQEALDYVKFYAYLHTLVDGLFGQIVDAMNDSLIDNTIIVRLADHGDMGMAHNGLPGKSNNAYQEAINIPMIFSNPVLYKQGVEVDSFAGLVDILPTLASIVDLPADKCQQFDYQGIDLSPTLLDPTHPTQESVLFTFDDHAISTSYPPPGDAHHIRCIRTADWKYAVYYALEPDDNIQKGWLKQSSLQYELYNLNDDPYELTNLLPVCGTASSDAKAEQKVLHQKLTEQLKWTQTIPKDWPKII